MKKRILAIVCALMVLMMPMEVFAAAGEIGYINGSNVVLRSSPGTNGGKMGLLQYGDRFKDWGSVNGWVICEMISGDNSGKTGYVSYTYCSYYVLYSHEVME